MLCPWVSIEGPPTKHAPDLSVLMHPPRKVHVGERYTRFMILKKKVGMEWKKEVGLEKTKRGGNGVQGLPVCGAKAILQE